MNIIVNEQPKRFWMAKKFLNEDKYEWEAVVGHEIKVNGHSFFIACLPGNILNVSEVTTGCQVFEMELTPLILMFTETKEETMDYYRDVIGERLKGILEKVNNFKERLLLEQEKQKALLGEMPKIEDVDDILITAPFNELMN